MKGGGLQFLSHSVSVLVLSLGGIGLLAFPVLAIPVNKEATPRRVTPPPKPRPARRQIVVPVTTKTIPKVITLPAHWTTINDDALPQGTRIVERAPKNGQREEIWLYTYRGKKLVSSQKVFSRIMAPVNGVRRIGTKVEPPPYVGGTIPNQPVGDTSKTTPAQAAANFVSASNRDDIDAVMKWVRLLGAEVNIKDVHSNTPLHWVAQSGDATLARQLVNQGADVNAKNTNDWTPLHYAAYSGKRECIQLFLERGADIEAQDRFGATPLQFASRFGRTDCVQLFLDKRANIEAKDVNGQTPLHEAAYHGYKTCVQLLLDRGANIEAKGNDGYTPLHKAAEWGKIDCVRLLLERGANINARNADGETPLALAETHLTLADASKKTEIAQLLRRLGGKK